MQKATYKDSGVDLELYEQSMARLPALMKRTHTPRVLSAEGGFAGLFQLDFAGKLFSRQYEDPVLVSCTDGVGTKLKVAQMVGVHNTVGIDLVAMCVNDALCCGAEPLFFLDYVAMSHDDPEQLAAIVEGISEGCLQSDSALVGGETAIMPDLYQRGDYDLAGFCVGVVDRAKMINGQNVSAGDVVIGVASSGLHSNGYSLVRKIVFEIAGLSIEDRVKECDATVGELLLTPTKIYTKPIRQLITSYSDSQPIHAIAHITGGGLEENLGRVLPEGFAADIKPNSWTVPPVFGWLQQLGNVDQAEMEKVFNLGVGLAIVVDADEAEAICQQLSVAGLENWQIGQIKQRK